MSVHISGERVDRYNRSGPRYTSYPTVPVWSESFGETEYGRALQGLAQNEQPLSLYLHLPFCRQKCHYCGCNSLSARAAGDVADYLDLLEKEVDLVTAFTGRKIPVVQMHWGGGSPNYLEEAALARAWEILDRAFDLDPTGDYSLEVDPRLGSFHQIDFLRRLGFNRVSLGVQDFNAEVQRAIGRLQSEPQTREVFSACRQTEFDSINLDLVYGLPGQTRESFAKTLDRVLEMAPDRLACFGYAHVPWVRPNQEKVDTRCLPGPQEKFRLFQQALDRFLEAGYVWIGLDHFARADDALTRAWLERRLHRNFMGYTTRPDLRMLAFGMSGISDLDRSFAQNSPDLETYAIQVGEGRLPVVKGHDLSEDDRLRRRVIMNLMCNLELPHDLTEAEFGQSVPEALGTELAALAPLETEGLVRSTPGRLEVTEIGRFFVRNISMVFDAYLGRGGEKPLFSKTI